MGTQRCYIKMCSEDILQQIMEFLSFKDKVQMSLTSKAFQNIHMAGPLEVHLAKQGQAEHTSVCTLTQLLESMSAEQKCRLRQLNMSGNNVTLSRLPNSQHHKNCRAVVGNLTVLQLHGVYLQLAALEAPGVDLRLKVLDLSGSALEANPQVLAWPLLMSNSPTLRRLILRKVETHIPFTHLWSLPDSSFKCVVLPRLEELDIAHFGVSYRELLSADWRARAHRLICCFLPHYKGAPNLTLLHFSPDFNNCIKVSSREDLAKLRSAVHHLAANLSTVELTREPHQRSMSHAILIMLPLLRLTDFTVRQWPLKDHEWLCDGCTEMAVELKCILRAAKVGMRLDKLTLTGFTCSDVDRMASEAEGACLAGVRELVLEPWLSEASLVALEDVLNTHPVDRLLHIFPDLKRLRISGQQHASLTLSVPCLHLEELSLGFCPASMNVNFASLRVLRLEYKFRSGLVQRAARTYDQDISAWACGQLESLIVTLGSYRKGYVFQVLCKTGKAMTAALSYPAEEWGQWVIGVSLAAGTVSQSRQRPVSFVCTSNHGLLTWGVAYGSKIVPVSQ